jgi:uncharacterized membrane protein
MSPSTRRIAGLAVVGAIVGIAVSFGGPWQLAVLSGWIGGLLVYLAVVWRMISRADGAATEAESTREDDSRAVHGILIVSASLTSLAGAAAALHRAAQLDGGAQPALLTTAAVSTVLLSWLAVHTDFTLRYAHLYYTPPVGGIDFPGAEYPDYRDFAYLAITIGMTYQVSDTGLRAPRFRRVLLAHAVLSYLFGAVIIAAVINIVAGLVN